MKLVHLMGWVMGMIPFTVRFQSNLIVISMGLIPFTLVLFATMLRAQYCKFGIIILLPYCTVLPLCFLKIVVILKFNIYSFPCLATICLCIAYISNRKDEIC